ADILPPGDYLALGGGEPDLALQIAAALRRLDLRRAVLARDEPAIRAKVLLAPHESPEEEQQTDIDKHARHDDISDTPHPTLAGERMSQGQINAECHKYRCTDDENVGKPDWYRERIRRPARHEAPRVRPQERYLLQPRQGRDGTHHD